MFGLGVVLLEAPADDRASAGDDECGDDMFPSQVLTGLPAMIDGQNLLDHLDTELEVTDSSNVQ